MDPRVWWPPAALAAGQLAWWPLLPALLDEPVRPAAVALALLGTAVACGALAWRHTAPGPALAATLAAAVPLGAGLGWSAPVGFVAAGVALFTLAAARTAGVSAAGAAATAVALTATVALRDASVRAVVGYGLIALAALTVVWVRGRARRRRRAGLAAAAVFEAGSAGIARHAAAAERRRLAAELHDVAAHRLTAIVVSTAAAARLADPALAAEATRHAVDAGRQALAELDRLAELEDDGAGGGLEGIARLAAERPEVTYTGPETAVPPEVAAVAYRVVREALTNTTRYAAGAPVAVAVRDEGAELVVSVVDGGGVAAAPDIGSGSGLAGLRALVESRGGTLSAGPERAGKPGWRVRAVLPQVAPAGGPRPAWRGPAALDWALTVLAVALPVGAGFLPGNQPDPLGRATPATALLLLFLVLFAAPLRWRRVAPVRAALANLAALLAWLGAERAGWTPAEGTDLLGYTLWAQLVLAYSVGAYRARRGWPAPLAIAAVDGFVMVSGLTGDVFAGWVIFTVLLAGPVLLAWAAGVWARARRRRRWRRRDAIEVDAAEAALAERARIAAGLRVTARRHAAAVVAAAQAGHLPEVLAEARAGLAAMRDLLADLRADAAGGEPPPTLAGVAVLAARRRAMVRYAGTRRALPAEVEVAGYRLAEALLRAEGTLVVTYLPDGVRLAATWPDPATPAGGDGHVDRRRLRDLADAAGGAVTGATPDAATVWLPG